LIFKGDDIKKEIDQFSFPAIIKSQIAIGSRKKAGLIKVAKDKNEAFLSCEEFFKKEVEGLKVEAILIEELVKIQHEYYCSIALDASGRQFVLITSKEGGIDIEEVAITRPQSIIKEKFSLTRGLSHDIARKVAEQLGFSNPEIIDSITDIFLKMWEITKTNEALLVEINPLVLTPSGFIAVDGKMILDDNAAFRQPVVQELLNKKLSDLEKIAIDAGFSFVELSGDIGILANGAGLTMALIDVLFQLGLKPANFLDVGGGASKARVYKALKLLFKIKPKCILINIFGGITRCDIVAEAIIQALNDFTNNPPMVIRLTGTKETEGIKLLEKAGINASQDIMDAIEKVKIILS